MFSPSSLPFLPILLVGFEQRDAEKRKRDELNSSNNLHGALAKGLKLDRNPTNTSFISTGGDDESVEPRIKSDTYAMMMI